jgi:TPR repeat protein
MDDWRRKLQRMNERNSPRSFFARHAGRTLSVGALLLTYWLVLPNNHPVSPEEVTMPPSDAVGTNTPGTTPEADGFDLFARGDYLGASEILRPLAEDGDLRAQCRLGIALARIAGTDRARQVEAVKWMDQCMRDPEHRYDEEDTVSRELTDALITQVGWDVVGEGRYRSFQFQQARLNFESGAPNGASDFLLSEIPGMGGHAAFQLGADLYNGNNMPVDYEKALLAFQRAATFGIPEAAFNVGLAYYAGKGTRADPVPALHWLKVAADGGFAQAATAAGIMLARGHGAPQDIDAALTYLRRGAALGDPDAALIAEAVAEGNIPH